MQSQCGKRLLCLDLSFCNLDDSVVRARKGHYFQYLYEDLGFHHMNLGLILFLTTLMKEFSTECFELPF